MLATRAVDNAGPTPQIALLPDEQMACAMERQANLLLWRLGRDELHVRPGNCFVDGLRVRGIVLLLLDVGLHVGRRHQAHSVAERLELPRPMARRGAGFDANQAWRQFLKNARTYRRFNCRRMPWTWNTELAMSRPIVVIACMLGSSKLWGPHPHSWHSRAGWRSRPQHHKRTNGDPEPSGHNQYRQRSGI
jgi:hypothetical protein